VVDYRKTTGRLTGRRCYDANESARSVINLRRRDRVLKDVSINHQTGASAARRAKSDPVMFGSTLADVFSAPAYDCRVLGQEQKPEFAVTRLR